MAMRNKLTDLIAPAKGGYNWQYCSLGGVTRVNITSGEDIAHLGELDQKMWTVLSCPVKGLEMEERTLHLIDSDNDDMIRVKEVVDAAQWLCEVLKNPDNLLQGSDKVRLDDLNRQTEEGQKLYEFAEQVLRMMQSDKREVSLAELDELFKNYNSTCQEELERVLKEMTVPEAPYGKDSDLAVKALGEVKDKVDDFFMRCKVLRYDSNCSAAKGSTTECQTEENASIVASLSLLPIAKPTVDGLLPLTTGINPAFEQAWESLHQLALAKDYPDRESITEKEWHEVVAKIGDYASRRDTLRQQLQAEQDERIKKEHDVMRPMEKLLRLHRDFYTLLRNYVMMADLYDGGEMCIFQAGKLYIDSRCCNLCLRVNDISRHNNMAKLSGMFLLYCTCTSQVKNETMEIVAVMTDGDIDNLRVGKNAVFYDRQGLDWDAVVTMIVDNPISIRQAFWRPYRKIGDWVSDKLNKSAAEKDAQNFAQLTSSAENTQETLHTQMAKKNEGDKETPKNTRQAFDIAKFAGIFAAVGVAFGFVISALTGLLDLATRRWYSIFFMVAIVIFSISTPSVFLAWNKLRKRNLGPLLNANGWSINARIVVNTRFGNTLTEMAKYPPLVLDDPYSPKRMAPWKRNVIAISVMLVAIFASLYFTNTLAKVGLPFHREESVIATVIDSVNSGIKETVEALTPDSNLLPPPPQQSGGLK